MKTLRLFRQEPISLEEKYFGKVRPRLYQLHSGHRQYGVRCGRTLAEHLDSACQFVLTVSKIAQVSEEKRSCILAATAVHDLNKLDQDKRSVKKLARDSAFLKEQLDRAGVNCLVQSNGDLELVRCLIESHSGHNNTDGIRFVAQSSQVQDDIKRWSAMLIGGDLFDLGIPEQDRIRKVENELTVALGRSSRLFTVTLAEDRGYLTALLLSACETVLQERGLHLLGINPDGQVYVGTSFPDEDITLAIAKQWQSLIDLVFSGNVDQLIKATKDGIKVDPKAIQQNPEAALDQVELELIKKCSGYKAEKVAKDIQKYGMDAGEDAISEAQSRGLMPVSTDMEFAISEGLKAAYLSYREADFSPQDAWNQIATQTGLSPEQRNALEPFNAQYGRSLFAAKAVKGGLEDVRSALQHSFYQRQSEVSEEASPRLIKAVKRLLNFPVDKSWHGFSELNLYADSNPKQRCSLGAITTTVKELISNKMPPGTKVQAFSNRLPGGMSAEPKRRGDTLSSLSYQLLNIGANFPKVSKQDPLYLHFALPQGSSPELQAVWRRWLDETAHEDTNGGTVTFDELQLYRDNEVVFKANKVVGMALPKRPQLIYATVTIPVLWGDVNQSIALLKSLMLALEISLAPDFGFSFILSANLEVESEWDVFGRVEGIPSSLQPLLGNGLYSRQGHLSSEAPKGTVTAEQARDRLRCLRKLAISVASLRKKDDCLYDLARSAQHPLNLYHVLLRWVLREQDDPNLEAVWTRLKEPLTHLLESLMSEEHTQISDYLKKAAYLAEIGKLRGSSFKRTAQTEPFSAFIKAVRSRKAHMDWDTVFAALVQDYHTRLDRIREHGVGATKHEQIKQFYDVLKDLFEDVYHSRPERLLTDRKTLESAYLFFLQDARQELKAKADSTKKGSSTEQE